MVLIEGMKREPGVEAAIELLVHWYSVEQPLKGIEEDVVRVVMIQPNPDDLLSALYDNLRVNQNQGLARSLMDHGTRLGLKYVPPAKSAEEIDPLIDPEEIPFSDDDPAEACLVPEELVSTEALAEESYPEEAAEVSEAPDRSSEREKPKTQSKPRTKKPWMKLGLRHGLGMLALLIASGLVWWALNNGKRVTAIRTLDTALETIDPLSGEQLLKLVESLERSYPHDPQIVERAHFVRVELGQRQGLLEMEDPITMWGVGALASSSIDRGDIEGGIRYVTHLERGFPGTIPAFWAKVRLAELRGHEREMLEALSELNRKFPDFLPGWIAKLRLDIRRMDREGMSLSKKRIEALVPDHPYAGIPDVIFPSPELVAGGFLNISLPTNTPSDWSDQSDEFLRSVSEFNRSIRSLHLGDYEEALESVTKALESEPKFGPALFISGLVKLRRYDLDGISALRLIAQIEGASDELLQMTQALGTVALSGLGRAADAGHFIPIRASDDTAGVQEGGFRRVMAEDASPYGAIAAYGGELVAYEMGKIQRLSAPLSTQDGRDRGAWDEVIQIYGQLNAGKAIHAGDVVLAHLALGHLEEALAELEEPSSILGDILLDGPRLLVGVWRSPSDPVQKERMVSLLGLEPSGVALPIWIADALIWQGDLQRAEAILNKVVSVQENNARASWLLGIVLRHRGEFRQSDVQFNKARPVLDVNSLIELGDRFSMTQNHDESRKMYHKAIIQDRANLRALRGLGRSYAELGTETAVRDLERIAQSYSGADWVAQRAETLKWLGVSLGVRAGNPAGLIPLEDAEKLVGKRADILVEQAQYHEATGDEAGARQLYGQALQSNSTLGEAHLGLGRTALRAKDLRIARDHLRKYLELVPRGQHRSWAEEKLSALE